MNEALQFLITHGYAILFIWVLAEQIGLPLPAIPILMGAGALSASRLMSLPVALIVAIGAAMLSDVTWYEIGRRRGAKVLNFLCRISLEPDRCVRYTGNFFTRFGARSLLVAKFVPGLNSVAPPLAGIFRMRWPRFLLFDVMGVMIWAGTYTGLGYIFSNQLERAGKYVAQFVGSLGVALAAALAVYVLWKYSQRRRIVRQLRVARVSSEELKARLDAGEKTVNGKQ